nr:hypothetical protein L203_06588 [Cryptococcus depauperatus CBS 7841]
MVARHDGGSLEALSTGLIVWDVAAGFEMDCQMVAVAAVAEMAAHALPVFAVNGLDICFPHSLFDFMRLVMGSECQQNKKVSYGLNASL